MGGIRYPPFMDISTHTHIYIYTSHITSYLCPSAKAVEALHFPGAADVLPRRPPRGREPQERRFLGRRCGEGCDGGVRGGAGANGWGCPMLGPVDFNGFLRRPIWAPPKSSICKGGFRCFFIHFGVHPSFTETFEWFTWMCGPHESDPWLKIYIDHP